MNNNIVKLSSIICILVVMSLSALAEKQMDVTRDQIYITVDRGTPINDYIMGPGRDFGIHHSGCNPPYPSDDWDAWLDLVRQSKPTWLKFSFGGNFWEDTNAWEWVGPEITVKKTNDTVIVDSQGSVQFEDLTVGMMGRFECERQGSLIVGLKIYIYGEQEEPAWRNGFNGEIASINFIDETITVDTENGTFIWPTGRGNDDSDPFSLPSDFIDANYLDSRWFWNSTNAAKKAPLSTLFALLDFCEENDIWVEMNNWDTISLNGPTMKSTHPERYDEPSDYPFDLHYAMADYENDVEEFGEYIAAIMYYLKVEANGGEGYDCIKAFCIFNEPGTNWGDRIIDFDFPGSNNRLLKSVDEHLELYGLQPGCPDIRDDLITIGLEGEPFYRTGGAAGYDRQNWTEMIGRGFSQYDDNAPGNEEPINYNCFTTGRPAWTDGDPYFEAISIHDYYSAFDYDLNPSYQYPFELNGEAPTIEDYLIGYKTLPSISQLATYNVDPPEAVHDRVFANGVGSFFYVQDADFDGESREFEELPRYEQSLFIAEETMRLLQIQDVVGTTRWSWNAHRHWSEAEFNGCWYNPDATKVDVVPVNFYPYTLVNMAIPRNSQAFPTLVTGDIIDTSCGFPHETARQRVWAGAFAVPNRPNQLLVISDSCSPKNLTVDMDEHIEDLTKYWVCEADYPEGGTHFRGFHETSKGNVTTFTDDIPGRSIVLYKTANDAEFLPDSTTVPKEVRVGSYFFVSVTMKNTGSTTWPSGSTYRLTWAGGTNPWETSSVNTPKSVAPGESVTFKFLLHAPKEPGSYPFKFQLKKNTMYFGESTDIQNIMVVLKPKPTPTPTPTFTPTPTPTPQLEFDAVIPFWQNDSMFYSFYSFKNSDGATQSVDMEMTLLNGETTPVAVFNETLSPGEMAITTTQDSWYTETNPTLGAAHVHLTYSQPPDYGDLFLFWSAIVNGVPGYPPGWTICPTDNPMNAIQPNGPTALQSGKAFIPYWENGGARNVITYFSLYNSVPDGASYGVPVSLTFHFHSMDGQSEWSKSVFLQSGEITDFYTLNDPDLGIPSGVWGTGSVDVQFGPGYNPGIHQVYIWTCVAGSTAINPNAQVGYTIPVENPMTATLYPPSCSATTFNVLIPYWKVDTASGMHFCSLIRNGENCNSVDATLNMYSVNTDHSLSLEATYSESGIQGSESHIFNTWSGGITGSHEGIAILTLDYGANPPAVTDVLSVWSLTYQYAANSYCSGVPAESPYTAIRPYILETKVDAFLKEATHEIAYWEESTSSTTVWTVWNSDTSPGDLTPTVLLYDTNGSLVSSVTPSTPIEPGEAWIINTDESWYTGNACAASGLITLNFSGSQDNANRAYVYETINGSIGNGSIDGYEVKVR